jgi:protein gp37
MSDFFHPSIPLWFEAKMFDVMRRCPQHTFQILTKRTEQLALFDKVCGWPDDSPNIWLGVSAENQATADERIPVLLKISAAMRFVSCEPLLERIVLLPFFWHNQGFGFRRDYEKSVNWVIAGAESGANHRHAAADWFRSLRDQCLDARVPFFLKQMECDGKVEKLPELDGRAWAEFPVVE